MKLLVCLLMTAYALLANAQTNVPANVAENEESDEAATQTAAPKAAPVAGGAAMLPASNAVETAAPHVPAQDPAKCIITRFSFDGNLQSSAGNGAVEATFKRPSTSFLNGAPVTENSPRFVEGRFGNALLLESGYANLFSAAQSSAAEAGAFYSLQGTTISISPDRPWQGKECLAISTAGTQADEGFNIEVAAEKAFYAKEDVNKPPAIVPAYYVASLYLRGDGNLKIFLKDSSGNEQGETVYAALSPEWQRFSCVFRCKFPRLNIGDKRDENWRSALPAGTNIDCKLQFVCATVDNQKLNFFADGFQLEKRHLASGSSTEISPHTWMPGASQAVRETLSINVREASLSALKKCGAIAFWFKPSWEAREGSAELILQIPTNQCVLAHNDNKIALSPAGTTFAPSDWKNNWHHLAITWNETGERILYVDGLDYANAAGQALPLKNPECIILGDLTKNLAPNGAIDELTLYNAALNLDQIKQLSSAEARPVQTAAPAVSAAAAPPPASAPAPAAVPITEQKPSSAPSANADDESEN